MKLACPVGRNNVTIEADGLKGLFMASGFFAAIPPRCGNCNSDDLVLSGKKNAGFDFYGILCRECQHELKFGQRKEDGGLFLKLADGWQPPYERGQQGGGGGGGRSQDSDVGGDIPF